MNKDKNSRADSDLSAAVCASAGASNPGDLSSPRIEYNAVRETASVRDLERCLEEKNKLLEEEKKLMEGKMIELKVELEKSKDQAYKAELKAFALDTLIQVADETYGFDLKKTLDQSGENGLQAVSLVHQKGSLHHLWLHAPSVLSRAEKRY